jgi:hypothetical protein
VLLGVIRNRGYLLRCQIREKFIDFIQKTQATALPKLRACVTEPPAAVQGPDVVCR